jgi:hypothetical protein
MGNQQSTGQEYTPEQYKQYLEYQEQLKRSGQLTQQQQQFMNVANQIVSKQVPQQQPPPHCK